MESIKAFLRAALIKFNGGATSQTWVRRVLFWVNSLTLAWNGAALINNAAIGDWPLIILGLISIAMSGAVFFFVLIPERWWL